LFKKFGIGVKWVKTDDPEEFRKAIDEKSKAIYIESIGNPKYNVPNIAEIAKVGPRRIRLSLSRLTGPPFRSPTRRIFP
jgi:O-acetylhomoserine/O-acetylserine sulfhydrylase-like pyridoxal-dependent enzyme